MSKEFFVKFEDGKSEIFPLEGKVSNVMQSVDRSVVERVSNLADVFWVRWNLKI